MLHRLTTRQNIKSCLILILIFTASAAGEDIKAIHIVTPSWEGFTNRDGTGLFFDMVRSIYEPVGINVKYEFIPWKRAKKMVSSEQADAMLSVQKQNVGEDMLTPVYPMVTDYTAAVFRKGMLEWKGPETLNRKTAVWLRGYDFHKNPNMEGIKLKKWGEIDEYKQAWGMLERDRIDVYMDALGDIQSYIRKNKVEMTPYQIETIWGEKMYMAFAKSERSEKLADIYDRRIIELFRSGELKKLFDKSDLYQFQPELWE